MTRWILACALVARLGAPTSAQDRAPAAERAELARLVLELRKAPGDDELRRRIIGLARKVRPVLPREARLRMEEGARIVSGASAPGDFKAAADAFAKAALAAPWSADAYRSLGMALDAAGDFMGAARALRFYLSALPDAPDLARIRVLIYQLEHRAAASVQPSSGPATGPIDGSPRMVADAKRMLGSGTWCTESNGAKCALGPRNAFGDGNGVWVTISVDGDSFRLVRETDAGRRATYDGMMTRLGVGGSCVVDEWTTGKILSPSSDCSFEANVSPDGKTVQMTSMEGRAGPAAWVYRRRD